MSSSPRLTSLSVGVFQVDEIGRVTSSNGHLETILGVPRQDTIDAQMSTVVDDDRPLVKAALAAALADQPVDDIEIRLELQFAEPPRATDTRRVCQLSLLTLKDDVGVVSGVIACLIDVTERAKLRNELGASSTRLRSALDAANEAYIEIDDDGAVVDWNAHATATFGWTNEEAIGRRLDELIIPSDQVEEHRRGLQEFKSSKQGKVFGRRFEMVARHRGGHDIPIELAIWATELDGRLRFHGFAHDISHRTLNEHKLRNAEESFRLLFEKHPLPMWVCDEHTRRFLEVNEAAVAQYGFTRDEFLAMGLTDINPRQGVSAITDEIARLDSSLHSGQVCQHRTKAGASLLVEITSQDIDFADRPCSLVMAMDVSERVRTEWSLVHQALYDDLTGLPNRSLAIDRVVHALGGAPRTSGGVAVISVGLDRFNLINDAYGHSVGDEVLRKVAQRLQSILRPEDTVARIGGDHFVILLQGPIDRDATVAATSRIAWSMEAPFYVESTDIVLSASQGVAFGDSSDTAETLLQRADAAMYRAKQDGGGRTDVANADLLARATGQLQLQSELRHAVDHGEFVVHYQPVVEVSTGQVVGAEALVRWQHPQRGLLAPAEFIASAEESGLIVPMGEWVLGQALADAASWANSDHSGRPLTIAVNLSAAQLASRNLAFVVSRLLSRTGVEPSRLHLEVTESLLIADFARSVEVLEALRGLGVRIDIDDFGTGYSSLAQVQVLPVDGLKIDKSFIDHLADPAQEEAIVASMIALGRSLDLKVIAEGVEDDTQRTRLATLGCELAQGYFLLVRSL